jgi:transcriptional regulator with XRE-family HTH domain
LSTYCATIILDMLDYMEVDVTKLKEIREARALSLRELADLSGVRHNTIWRIEAGQRKRTHPRTIRKLAQALGVEPTDLIRRARG